MFDNFSKFLSFCKDIQLTFDTALVVRWDEAHWTHFRHWHWSGLELALAVRPGVWSHCMETSSWRTQSRGCCHQELQTPLTSFHQNIRSWDGSSMFHSLTVTCHINQTPLLSITKMIPWVHVCSSVSPCDWVQLSWGGQWARDSETRTQSRGHLTIRAGNEGSRRFHNHGEGPSPCWKYLITY